MNILFDLASLYYWPQYEPVFFELTRRGHTCKVCVHAHDENTGPIDHFLEQVRTPSAFHLVPEQRRLEEYVWDAPDWIVFGDGNFDQFSELSVGTHTALLYHGIGVKSSYYEKRTSLFDVRFTEGTFRHNVLRSMYPDARFEDVGFAKLDPLFNPEYFNFEPIQLNTLGLREDRPTLLYAPTFYPSSIECMPEDWPARLNNCNVIIKPHFFTLSKRKYHEQRKLLARWQRFDNVHIASAGSVSLLPYMAISDILVSEASSSLFEFAALNKPIIWLDSLHLRWSYRGIFRYRFNRRMDNIIDEYRDVALHLGSPAELRSAVDSQLSDRNMFAPQRLRATTELIGYTDGKASLRIADYLERFQLGADGKEKGADKLHAARGIAEYAGANGG
ncbi:MAG TPA: CDP-glycerol glycerophosphotransferase family protein [Gammaproteobacteria bacterium]|nr:CDP-glycerol glycerophosphotransferase family protein [Gammaproteobacteria bacterium]